MKLPKNRLKAALRKTGNRVFGVWTGMASPTVAEVLSNSGFDFAVIDMEHAPNDLSDVVAQLRAANGGTVPFAVRPPWNDFVMIKRLLDAGVQSLIIPFVQNADEARAAIAATRYPPDGIRGVAGGSRATGYGQVTDYFKNAHKELCVILQVETGAAVEQIEAIASVRGVDGIFIGPADLSASLGHLGDMGHEDVVKVMADALGAIKASGKAALTLSFNAEQAESYAQMGFDGVVVGSDQSLMMDAARDRVAAFSKFRK